MGAALSIVMTDPLDEPDEVVRGLRLRDPAVLNALIERHQHRLFRYLLYLTGQRALAEDLFQETWVRVLEQRGGYDGRSGFVPWLLTIARHLAVDHFRRRAPLSLEALTDEGAGDGPAATDTAPSPYERAAATEGRAHLADVLDALPAIHREVLMLRFQEDLSLAEIAGVVGVPESTVKSRLYRALESARRLWGERR